MTNKQLKELLDSLTLKEKIGHITDTDVMNQVNNAIGISFGLDN